MNRNSFHFCFHSSSYLSYKLLDSMAMQIFFLFTFISLSLTIEHWFIFYQYQFPGFYTPLFTLMSLSNNQTNRIELLFTLSTYDCSIIVDINIQNSNGTTKQYEQLTKLDIERADLLSNIINHMIFIVIRNRTKFETYVNCKLIDSYLLHSSTLINNSSLFYKIKNITKNIEHYELLSANEQTQQEIFDKFSCKQTSMIMSSRDGNATSKIGQPLIRKMQHVIEKVQRRKLRAR